VAKEIHCLPTLLSRQPQTTESRAGSDNAGPRSDLNYRKRALFKEALRFSAETDSTATDGAVSLVLGSRSTQSIFGLFFIRGELRPLHSC